MTSEELKNIQESPCSSCTFPAQSRKQLILNGAGEGNRTLVSALGRPHSTIEPHPLNHKELTAFYQTAAALATGLPWPITVWSQTV